MHRSLVLMVAVAMASSAAAQGTDKSIDPGMNRAQVVEHLGAPVSTRSSGSMTFMYYRNGCEKKCGMQDVVILDHDAVVDVIFRAPDRRYTGTSSSPSAKTSKEAAARSSGTLSIPASDHAPPDSDKAERVPQASLKTHADGAATATHSVKQNGDSVALPPTKSDSSTNPQRPRRT